MNVISAISQIYKIDKLIEINMISDLSKSSIMPLIQGKVGDVHLSFPTVCEVRMPLFCP